MADPHQGLRPRPANQAQMSLTVMTYNVNWGYCLSGLATAMCHRILKAIREANADVVCLQETHEGWESFLAKELSARYPHMIWRHHVLPHVKTHLEEGSSAGGLAYLSKYPLAEVFHAQPEVSGSFFPGMLVTVTSPAGPIDLMNVHLRPPVSSTHRPSVLAVFQTGIVRRAELKYLVAELCDDAPMLIVGDFNEGHNGDAVRWLMGGTRRFKDALYLFDEAAITWKWPLKMGLCLKGTYDHIMYNPTRLHLKHCRVMSEYELVSDHMPVVASFDVPMPARLSTDPPAPTAAPDEADGSVVAADDEDSPSLEEVVRRRGPRPLTRAASDLLVTFDLMNTATDDPPSVDEAQVFDIVDTTGQTLRCRSSMSVLMTTEPSTPILSPRERARCLGNLCLCRHTTVDTAQPGSRRSSCGGSVASHCWVHTSSVLARATSHPVVRRRLDGERRQGHGIASRRRYTTVVGEADAPPPPAVPGFMSMVEMRTAIDDADPDGGGDTASQGSRSSDSGADSPSRGNMLKKLIPVASTATGPAIGTVKKSARPDNSEAEQPLAGPIRYCTDEENEAVVVELEDLPPPEPAQATEAPMPKRRKSPFLSFVKGRKT